MSDFITIAERMKKSAKLKNNSALARKLELTPQALSNYKKKGRMPYSVIFKFANLYDISLDWLVKGKGDPPQGVVEKNAKKQIDVKSIANKNPEMPLAGLEEIIKECGFKLEWVLVKIEENKEEGNSA